jgi:hypothetical protein
MWGSGSRIFLPERFRIAQALLTVEKASIELFVLAVNRFGRAAVAAAPTVVQERPLEFVAGWPRSDEISA